MTSFDKFNPAQLRTLAFTILADGTSYPDDEEAIARVLDILTPIKKLPAEVISFGQSEEPKTVFLDLPSLNHEDQREIVRILEGAKSTKQKFSATRILNRLNTRTGRIYLDAGPSLSQFLKANPHLSGPYMGRNVPRPRLGKVRIRQIYDALERGEDPHVISRQFNVKLSCLNKMKKRQKPYHEIGTSYFGKN